MKLELNIGLNDILSIIPQMSSLDLETLKKEIDKEYIKTKSNNERKFGCMKGLVSYMSDDFNEPIDDFKDYM